MRCLAAVPFLVAFTVALTAPVRAQNAGITAGFGRTTFESPQMFASQYLSGVATLGDEIWVAVALSPPVFEIRDATSRTVLRTQNQPSVSQPFGFRGGASDGERTLWGSTAGVYVVEADGTTQLSTVLQTASGPRTVLNPIPKPATSLVVNGVAFDPAGDAGRGSVWVSTFSQDVYELDLSGGVLRSIPAPSGWRLFGICYDRERGTLWCDGDGAGRIAELDPASGLPTGAQFDTGAWPEPFGLDWIDGTRSEGRPCGRDLLAIKRELPVLTAFVRGYRLDLIDGYGFENEPKLLVGVDGVATSSGVVTIDPTHTGLAFDLDRPGVPYALFFNFEPESTLQRPVGPLAGLFPEAWEFRRIFVPGITSVTTTSGTPFTAPASWYGSNWPLGQQLRVQAVYIDPAISGCGPYLPLGVTNEAGWDWVGSRVVVRTRGDDSATVGTAPFWTVELAPQFAGSVVRLKIDFSTSFVPMHASYRFRPAHARNVRTGQQSFRYGPGGGASPNACVGTYRGSDRDVSLDYGWVGVNLQSSCGGSPLSPGARLDANDQSMEWRFASGGFAGGESFVFDLRVQDGTRSNPVGGADVAGARVTIGLADGRTVTRALVQDAPNSALASFPF